MDNSLHIIVWDIPFPADYGGVIDVWYKIKSLHQLGIKIWLHCFQYGDRKPNSELNKYCEHVFYYPRKTGLKGLHPSLPYIVSSRISKDLLLNLMRDDSPILFEGIHTTFLLNADELRSRKKIVRMHNVEHQYYQQLATHTSSFFKKLYYYFESSRLFSYENQLQKADVLLTISQHDCDFFQKKYPNKIVSLLPAFHPTESLEILSGKGTYCLYHGNLSVAENIEAVKFLTESVFSKLNYKLIVAGKSPSEMLLQLSNNHVELIANPSEEQMATLIANAHIHVLPSFQDSGIKLKLLHALFKGRHCIANSMMIDGTGLSETVSIANSALEFISEIEKLMPLEFTQEMIEKRKQALAPYSNRLNTETLINILH